MVYTYLLLRYTVKDILFKGRVCTKNARPVTGTAGDVVWRGEIGMKSRKHVLKIAAFFAVVAMLLGCTISTWAREIKKDYRVTIGNGYGFSILLDKGESVSKIKVNKKGLKCKLSGSYVETTITDAAKVAEQNKEIKNKDDKIKEGRVVTVRTMSSKIGKYKVTFTIKKGKKKKTVKTTVHVTSGPISSVKFAGKTYKVAGKYQGSKYLYPATRHEDFITKKSSGKFSAKPSYGYKIVGYTYRKYNSDDDYDYVKYNKQSVKLIKDKTTTTTDPYYGYKRTYKDADDTGVAVFKVYVYDKLNPENSYTETSGPMKGKKISDEISFWFYNGY